MTPTSILQRLWEDGFFEDHRFVSEVLSAIKNLGCTFPRNSVLSALTRADYLTPTKNSGKIVFSQRFPFGTSRSIEKNKESTFYISRDRINELKEIKNKSFDFTRLLKMCDELNSNFTEKNYISVIILVRTIIDHISPIFDFSSFKELANNYKCAKSLKDSFTHLENSSRKIADGYLHIQMRDKETLPTVNQVNFSPDIDLLLGEIVRVLK